MSDEVTEPAKAGNTAQAAAAATKKRKKATPDRLPEEWEQLAKAWRVWNPEPADPGPEALRKALFKIVDIAIKRKGEARTALDVKASDWLAWLDLPGTVEAAPQSAQPASGDASRAPSSVDNSLGQRSSMPPRRPDVERAPMVAPASTPASVPVAAPASSPTPPPAPSGASGSAPTAAPASASAPSVDVLKVADVVARRLDKLDTALRQRADAIIERQESAEDAGRRFEQSLTHATRSIPALANRIEELERSSRAAVAALRDLHAATAAKQERAEADLRQLLEREMGVIRAAAQTFGDGLDERLRAKIDLTDVTRLLEVQQHVEERVQADLVRRASRRIAPAVDALRAALAEGDTGRTKSAFDELCTACRVAGLVLDLTQIF